MPAGKVLPSSRERSVPSSTLRLRMVSPIRSSASARSWRLPRAHAGAAATAAAMARLACAASARVYSPTTSSRFEGFRFRLVSTPDTHSPATKLPCAVMGDLHPLCSSRHISPVARSNQGVPRQHTGVVSWHDSRREGIDVLSPDAARKEFEPAEIYVNTASIGLPPRRTVEALQTATETWRTGRAEAAGYDPVIARARQLFAGLVGSTPERVFIGNQVSTFTALVAAALGDGAHVLAAEEDFTSVLYPFLAHADRGVQVQTVPLARLVDAIDGRVDLVAVSAVQSADGRVVPGGLDALAAAATAHGCLTYVDATQAVGWLPFRADDF